MANVAQRSEHANVHFVQIEHNSSVPMLSPLPPGSVFVEVAVVPGKAPAKSVAQQYARRRVRRKGTSAPKADPNPGPIEFATAQQLGIVSAVESIVGDRVLAVSDPQCVRGALIDLLEEAELATKISGLVPSFEQLLSFTRSEQPRSDSPAETEPTIEHVIAATLKFTVQLTLRVLTLVSESESTGFSFAPSINFLNSRAAPAYKRAWLGARVGDLSLFALGSDRQSRYLPGISEKLVEIFFEGYTEYHRYLLGMLTYFGDDSMDHLHEFVEPINISQIEEDAASAEKAYQELRREAEESGGATYPLEPDDGAP